MGVYGCSVHGVYVPYQYCPKCLIEDKSCQHDYMITEWIEH